MVIFYKEYMQKLEPFRNKLLSLHQYQEDVYYKYKIELRIEKTTIIFQYFCIILWMELNKINKN